MKLYAKQYEVRLDNSNARAEIAFGIYGGIGNESGHDKWCGRAEIMAGDLGLHATRRAAQEALAGMLRALADKVMADPVDESR